jgi:hypothetical protein
MTFASPLWLLALFPWLGVSLYLIWGRRKRRDVPFLELWRGPAAVEHAKWKVSAPPIALAMMLLAMLAAVLGAARPGTWWGPENSQTTITVVVDRGLTMSARGGKDLRFREAGRDAADAVAAGFGPGVPIDAWGVPSRGPFDKFSNVPATTGDGNAERFSSPGAWANSLDRLPPTAIESTESVRQTVRHALAAGPGPVVVVSDAAIGIDDSRLVEVAPQTAVRNAGIALLAVRDSPRPQVMVRVRNDSPLTSATLEVNFGDTGDAPVRRTIDLPPTGGERNFFFNARRLGMIVSADLIVADDLEADNKAWLVRESGWPRVELSRPPGGLSRLVDVYTKLHAPGDGSHIVRVVSQVDELAPGESGVVIGPGPADAASAVRPTHVVPHPITDAVRDWPSLELPADSSKPPGDLTPLLSAGDQTLVAVHEGPGAARQVWVGLDSAGWSDRPEYVAFWAAAFDWAGSSQRERYASHSLDAFDPSWKPAQTDEPGHDPGTWPGLYQRGDGVVHAFNTSMPWVVALARPDPEWRQKLNGLRSTGPGYRDLSSMPLLASSAFIFLAAATWRKAHATGTNPLLHSPQSRS